MEFIASGGTSNVFKTADNRVFKFVGSTEMAAHERAMHQRAWIAARRVVVRDELAGVVRPGDRDAGEYGIAMAEIVEPWPDEPAHELVLDIARALDAVHAACIVHRDLRRPNLGVRPAAGRRRAVGVILDWGFARDAGTETRDFFKLKYESQRVLEALAAGDTSVIIQVADERESFCQGALPHAA
jgi:hypothetical protein